MRKFGILLIALLVALPLFADTRTYSYRGDTAQVNGFISDGCQNESFTLSVTKDNSSKVPVYSYFFMYQVYGCNGNDVMYGSGYNLNAADFEEIEIGDVNRARVVRDILAYSSTGAVPVRIDIEWETIPGAVNHCSSISRETTPVLSMKSQNKSSSREALVTGYLGMENRNLLIFFDSGASLAKNSYGEITVMTKPSHPLPSETEP